MILDGYIFCCSCLNEFQTNYDEVCLRCGQPLRTDEELREKAHWEIEQDKITAQQELEYHCNDIDIYDDYGDW